MLFLNEGKVICFFEIDVRVMGWIVKGVCGMCVILVVV